MNAKVRAVLGLKSKLLDRYADQIEGILGCYDRLIFTGTLVDVAHPDALTLRLHQLNIHCFDLKVFAERLHDQVHDSALRLARAAGPRSLWTCDRTSRATSACAVCALTHALACPNCRRCGNSRACRT